MDKPLIISIHGIGSTKSHYALKKILHKYGYQTIVFKYPTIDISLEFAAKLLDECINKLNKPVILIGHSAGGRVALLAQHKNIIGIVTVASPIKGSWCAYLAFPFLKYWYGNIIKELAFKHDRAVTVPLLTISTDYYFSFDGRLWCWEMHHDKSHKIHVPNMKHSGRQILDDRIITTLLNFFDFLQN